MRSKQWICLTINQRFILNPRFLFIFYFRSFKFVYRFIDSVYMHFAIYELNR